MNLLKDAWIPVKRRGGMEYAVFSDILCQPDQLELQMPRDDMEMGALQLLICLTQVMFMPKDDEELRRRLRVPMTLMEYEDSAAKLDGWFSLDHPNHPFMQVRGVNAKEPTPIQKLMVGLPEGNNHCFFNMPGEIKMLGGPAAAIALFQQASATPSFGGGFKAPLRGSAPLTTIIWDSDLRRIIWRNVLTLALVMNMIPGYKPELPDEPTWVRPIDNTRPVFAHDISFLRGLFWQPAHIELVPAGPGGCDFLGGEFPTVYHCFNKAKFSYVLEGLWPHPQSPKVFSAKRAAVGQSAERYVSFRAEVPGWAQSHGFITKYEKQGEGASPAPVVAQFARVFAGEPLHLMVGGYCNDQAKVVERRHELYSFGPGWEEDAEARIVGLVDMALEARKTLMVTMKKLQTGVKKRVMRGSGLSLHKAAEQLFYQRTEALIHKTFREFTRRSYSEALEDLGGKLLDICTKIYDDVTQPLQSEPAMLATVLVVRRDLRFGLRRLSDRIA